MIGVFVKMEYTFHVTGVNMIKKHDHKWLNEKELPPARPQVMVKKGGIRPEPKPLIIINY